MLRDEQQLALAEARKTNSDRLFSSAQKHREAGSVPQLDVALAALQQGRDAAAASTAAGERDASLLRLAALLGHFGPPLGKVAGLLVPGDAPPPLGVMLRQVDNRADVQAAAARTRAAQARAARERSAGSPSISLLAQYERDDGDNIGTIGVAVPIPILNANTLPRATSAAEVKAAQSQYAAVRAAAEGEIRELYTRYEATKRSRELLAPTAGVVKESVALALRTYELGESDLASVLLVHREALEAERALLEADYAHASAKLELLIVAGRTPE